MHTGEMLPPVLKPNRSKILRKKVVHTLDRNFSGENTEKTWWKKGVSDDPARAAAGDDIIQVASRRSRSHPRACVPMGVIHNPCQKKNHLKICFLQPKFIPPFNVPNRRNESRRPLLGVKRNMHQGCTDNIKILKCLKQITVDNLGTPETLCGRNISCSCFGLRGTYTRH